MTYTYFTLKARLVSEETTTEKNNVEPEKVKNPEKEKPQENIEGTIPVKPSHKD